MVLSKIDKNDVVPGPTPEYLLKYLRREQRASNAFVINKYARFNDGMSLGWLPILERK